MRAMMQSYFFLLFCRFFFLFPFYLLYSTFDSLYVVFLALSLFFCLFLLLILLLCVSLLLLFWLLSPLYSNLSIGFSSATVVTVYYYAMLCYLIGSAAAAALHRVSWVVLFVRLNTILFHHGYSIAMADGFFICVFIHSWILMFNWNWFCRVVHYFGNE